MAFSKFQKIKSDDDVLNTVQDNVAAVLDPIVKNVPVRKVLTNVILLSGITTKVPHGLGQRLEGWRIIRQRGQSIIWDTQDANLSPHLYLYLTCTISVVVDIECT